jgi:UDP-N-acetylenolpyruvoylglucosamine reductase
MMNGLKISDGKPQEEAMDFEGAPGPAVVSSDAVVPSQGSLRRRDNFAEQKRKEHEEYKKKRDADPAFIPTRGSFFMHDHRHSQAQDGARLLGRGRGRGTVVGGPFSPAKYVHQMIRCLIPN